METLCRQIIADSVAAKQRFLESDLGPLARAAELLVGALRSGGKVLAFGNGGSAADAQHLAGELVNRFLFDRPALPAVALTTDTSVITSIANDASYDEIFSRQVEALGRPGDIAVGISTSGGSPNVLLAIRRAREMGLRTLAITGRNGGALAREAELAVVVPEASTPRIQEVHLTILHVLCQAVEEAIFPQEPAP